MSLTDGANRAGLIARVQNILLRPGPEWDVIETEAATVPGLFVGYACILAAIPLIAMVLQHLFFIHWMLVPSLVIAVLGYFASLLGVFITGFIIDALAPSFDGQRNLVQAMKLAVYPYTAVWVAGILYILPVLGILVIIAAIYGLYILYLGVPKLMKSPDAKTAGYTAVSVIAAIIVNAVIGAVVASISLMLAAGAILGGATALSSAAANNGELASLAAASRQIAAASSASSAATSNAQADPKAMTAIDSSKLKALLPDTVAGLPKTESSSTTVAPGGLSTSKAEAVYSQGAARIDLPVTDISAMGAFARIAGVTSIESEKQTATGYEKVGKVDGRMTTEEWDRNAKSGKFGVLVADRVMVQAEGSGVTMDDLKAAVASVGPERVEGIVKG